MNKPKKVALRKHRKNKIKRMQKLRDLRSGSKVIESKPKEKELQTKVRSKTG